jgi:tetratricopeptide (TPR) repeat protein
MSDPTTSSTDSPDADGPLRLFWRRFGDACEPDGEATSQRDAARRIVAAVGSSTEAASLAATFAMEFSLDLSALADELEHPAPETLRMTPQPPTGRALIAATAARQGQRQQSDGDLPGAERRFRWAAQAFHALDEQRAESLALTLLGRAVEMQDRLDDAAQCYSESLALDYALGDTFNEGVDLALLGQVAWLSGHLDDAEHYAREALTIHRRHANQRNIASTLATLGAVAKARGQRVRAAIYVLQSRLTRLGLM